MTSGQRAGAGPQDPNQVAWTQYGAWLTSHNRLDPVDANRSPAPEAISALGHSHTERLAHLLCGTGSELAHAASVLHAKYALGIDWAEPLIEHATRTYGSTSAGNSIEYRCETVDDAWSPDIPSFDAVITTYGSAWWMPRPHTLINAAWNLLRPGGTYVMSEIHPQLLTLDVTGRQAVPYPTGTSRHEHDAGLSDYILDDATYGETGPVVYFIHSLAATLSAAAKVGFHLRSLAEFPWMHQERFLPCMQRGSQDRWILPEPASPATFLCVLERPA